MLQYCDACQSAMYCSRACQRIDWKTNQHKKICKHLNVGHGDRQVRSNIHQIRQINLTLEHEEVEQSLDEGKKRFFKLFEESTFEGSRAAAQKMKKFAKRLSKENQKLLLFHSLRVLARSDSEMLSWPNSPLLVLLHFVDSNVLCGDVNTLLQGGEIVTPLHALADLTDPYDYSTHVNQLILARQLIENGANVNAVSSPYRETPLHKACLAENVTNLDFLELLLDEGADPNHQDFVGRTPLMFTTKLAPGTAKFLLYRPATDANITTRSGASFLAKVCSDVKHFSDAISLPNNPDRVQHQFVLQQWREIEAMLVERGADNTGIAAFE
jgi:hypothetical protein